MDKFVTPASPGKILSFYPVTRHCSAPNYNTLAIDSDHQVGDSRSRLGLLLIVDNRKVVTS